MKLYTLNYSNRVIELTVINETPYLFVYTLPNSTTGYTILKTKVDRLNGRSVYRQFATSVATLERMIKEIKEIKEIKSS